MIEDIDRLISGVQWLGVNINQVMDRVLRELIAEILEFNRDEQLYNLGVNTKSVKISSYRPYAESTIKRKKRKGYPYDHVTTRETGNMHENMAIQFKPDSFKIVFADVDYSKYVIKMYGENILGLTVESIEKLRILAYPILMKFLNEHYSSN